VQLLSRILFILIAVIAVVFAVSNRAPATLNLWPLPFEATLPLYMIVLGVFALGLLIGAAISWIGKERMWLRARGAERRVDTLERKAEAEREAGKAAPPPGIPAPPALAPARAARISDE
jgi:uncharacterized integral membrane protein